MSTHSPHLRQFLTLLPAQQVRFPKEQIITFLSKTKPTQNQTLMLFKEMQKTYLREAQKFRQLFVLLYISMCSNMTALLEDGLQLVEGLMKSKLILLMFSKKGEFQLDDVLSFMQETVELLIRNCLQSGMQEKILDVLGRANDKQIRFNQVNFLMEFLLIRKIQKQLDAGSLQEFRSLLSSMLSANKLKYVQCSSNSLHFKQIAILRQEEDRPETYHLQYIGNKLVKLKETPSSQVIQPWVQQAYFRLPKQVNLNPFRSKKILQVLQLLMQVEVFASSPNIEQLDSYLDDEQFFNLFQKFLLGYAMGDGEYRFGWMKVQQSLQQIRQKTAKQRECYYGTIASQVNQMLRQHT